jgi:pyruvate/2-oxoglutarate/acetoin dehydrogenase E1 component
VRRVAYPDRPAPYNKKLEASLLPDQRTITDALRALARY